MVISLLMLVVVASIAIWAVRHSQGGGATATELKGFGFSTSLEGLSTSALNQKLDAIKATGATWVRYALSWDDVQHSSSKTYNWASYDVMTKAVVAHGLRPLAIIDFTPAWARPDDCSSNKFCATTNFAAMGSFAAAAAARYAPMGLHDWEIWNEPNIQPRFLPGADPVQYTNILKAVYPAIKRVDPHAMVLSGGLSPASTLGRNFRPEDFVTALYQAGAQGSFDALSTHPYTYPTTPAASNPADAWGQMATIRNLMQANGDSDKQVWITEFGAPTSGPDDPAQPHVTEAVQAEMVTEAIQIFRGHSWAGPFLWYDYQDASANTISHENFFGLVRADGSFKPAYYTFQQAVAKYR
jgi:beta-xylosidase